MAIAKERTHQIQRRNHRMRRSACNDTAQCTRREVISREELNLLLRLHCAQFVGHCVVFCVLVACLLRASGGKEITGYKTPIERRLREETKKRGFIEATMTIVRRLRAEARNAARSYE